MAEQLTLNSLLISNLSHSENGPLAQLAEQGTLNALVQGSSPWGVTKMLRLKKVWAF